MTMDVTNLRSLEDEVRFMCSRWIKADVSYRSESGGTDNCNPVMRSRMDH
jgi:hypothetical protein